MQRRPAAVSQFGAASTIASPAQHGPLGVVRVRLRIAEIGEYAVAHVFGDEAAIALDELAAALG